MDSCLQYFGFLCYGDARFGIKRHACSRALRYFTAAFLFCLFAALPAGAYAGSCDDVKESASNAAGRRNDQVRDVYDKGMPNPGDIRGNIAGCLDVIVNSGNIYSMGATTPDLESLLDGLCNEASDTINSSIDQALQQAKQTVGQATGRYSVTNSADGIANEILSNIK